jgi:hypothetical protein
MIDIRWWIGQRDPSWTISCILTALESLRPLQSLELNVLEDLYHYPGPYYPDRAGIPTAILTPPSRLALNVPLDDYGPKLLSLFKSTGDHKVNHLSLVTAKVEHRNEIVCGLYKFISASPSVALKSLDIGYITVDQDTPADGQTFRHPSFRSLSSIHLRRSDCWPALWTLLTNADIMLREIITDELTPPLIEYLSTYSAVECLKLEKPRLGHLSDLHSPVILSALSNHQENLQRLTFSCSPQMTFIQGCKGLVELELFLLQKAFPFVAVSVLWCSSSFHSIVIPELHHTPSERVAKPPRRIYPAT